MVHSAVKSPLALSIGGVGLIVMGVIALSYLQQSPGLDERPTSSEAITASDTAELVKPTATDPWGRAMEYGWAAATAAQSAQTQADWKRVGDLWLQAVAELEQIPQDSPQAAQAQAKRQEYLKNFGKAEERRATAPAEPQTADPQLSQTMMQSALENTPLAYSFTGPQGRVGKSADGMATVQFSGPADDLSEVRLVVKGKDAPPSMAQMVYANQFLAVVAPDWTVRTRWLSSSLQRLRDKPGQPITSDYGPRQIQLSLEPDKSSLVITVSGERE